MRGPSAQEGVDRPGAMCVTLAETRLCDDLPLAADVWNMVS